MNRKQRRYTGNPKQQYTPEQIELAKLMFVQELCRGRFKEGDKVKLNMKEIKGSPDWERKVLTYRSWCLAHADDVLTVEYDYGHKEEPSFVCLAEDEGDPKWLFSVIDLMPADGDDGFMEKIEWARAAFDKKKPTK